MPAGSIIVDFLARTGTFETDVGRATKSVERFSKGVKDSFLGNLGAGFARDFIRGIASIPGKMVDLVKSSIDAADHLGDLSKATGVAVETLGGIGFAASQAGSSLEGVASGIGKLNQSLAKAASGNKEAAASLKALGVTVIDPLTGKTIEADKALIQIADTFEKAGNSPEKFRAAALALGKQYQELAPLLADGGKALRENIEYYKRYGGVTEETKDKADAFNDTLGKINLLSSAFGRTLAAELLTPLQAIASAFLDAKEKGDGFKGTAVGIKDALVGVAGVAQFIIQSLSAMASRFDGFVQKAQAVGRKLNSTKLVFPFVFDTGNEPSLGDQFRVIDQLVADDVASAQKRYDDFVKKLETGGGPTPKKPKGAGVPGMPSASAAAEAEARLKRLLDGQLKLIRDFGEDQKEALAYANKLLEGEYQDHEISLATFFEDQKTIRARALQAQIAEQDQIIAAEAAFAKRTSNPTSRIDAENKIAEASRAKSRLIIKNGEEEELALQQNRRDVKALEDAFRSLNAQILDLQENFAAAAAIKFDAQNDALKKTFTAEGKQAGLDALDTLRAASIAQAAFQKASLESGRTFEALQRQEEFVAIAQQTGALTTIEALIKVGEIRKSQIPILEAQVAAEEAIAKASGNKALIANAEQARIALEKLKATAEPLALELKGIFEGAFSNAFADFITGSATAAQAFKSFAKSVISSLAQIASQQLAKQIFGGFGSFNWGSLFGSSGGTGIGGAEGSSFMPSYAVGTNQVMKDGPAFLHKNEAVVPARYNPAIGGGRGIVFNIQNETGEKFTARKASQQETDTATIVGLVLESVAGDVGRGGPVHRAMADTYGLNRGRGLPKRG